jgi:hypothetical protein
MKTYRMTYTLAPPGPPKSIETLGPNEGLTDTLVVASILEGDGRSFSWLQLGPDGVEPMTAQNAYDLAVSLLAAIENADVAEPLRVDDHRVAVSTALRALRGPVLARRRR